MNTLQKAEQKAYDNMISEFHFYIKELDLETAKKIIRESSRNSKVLKYIENYKNNP